MIKRFGIDDVLENLNQFPLEIDDELTEYYETIANKVDIYPSYKREEFRYGRFYVQKIKPFFVNEKIYYEIACFVKTRNRLMPF